MAKVIEFYVPTNFQKSIRSAPRLQPGKVIEFCSRTSKSAALDISSIWETWWGLETEWSRHFST